MKYRERNFNESPKQQNCKCCWLGLNELVHCVERWIGHVIAPIESTGRLLQPPHGTNNADEVVKYRFSAMLEEY